MQTDTTEKSAVKRLPILPLRDVVVYPHTVIPLFVGRERSVTALDRAMAAGREILLVAQTQPDIDDPSPKDIYEIATLATILQLLKLPDGTVKVLVEGIRRARLRNLEVGRVLHRGGRGAVRRRRLRPARDGGAHALGHVALRSIREAQQEDPARDPDFAVGHRFAGPARRYRRRPDGAEALREAEGARDRGGAAAPGARARAHRRRDRHAAHREADPRPRKAADGEEPARVLPE